MSLRKYLPAALVLGLVVACAAQQAGKRGTAEAMVHGKKVSISYGRPSVQGRDLLAQAPDGMVWRLGMNEATEITTDGTLVVDGKELTAGKYTLWVRKTGADTWSLAFHPKTGVWGKPELREGYAAETPLKLDKATDSAEQLMVDLADKSGTAEIKIHWGTALLTGSFGVK
ncbi:MAG: DUF2911 domain-containing protein [Pyrinomonadaceae bacterium]